MVAKTLSKLIAGILLVQPAFAQPVPLIITFKENNKAAVTCARALDETKQALAGELSVRLLPQRLDSNHRSIELSELKGVYIELRGYDWASGKLEQLPFLFRDAEHFQAYLTSDVYADFDALRAVGTDNAIAHAYGGFFQIFSYQVAVTQPSHFHNRFIAGIAQAPDVYREFGGESFTGIGFLGVDEVAEDARRMASGDRTRNMVEGLLINALEYGLDRNARFVNLISSTVNTVYFEGSYDLINKLPNETKMRIRAWAQAAAARCSAENYQTEIEVLDRLKRAGLKIVPFNRRAMYEAGIISALRSSHTDFTVNDLDRIVSLGKRDPSMVLPSQLLRRAGPEAIKHEQEASTRRKKYLDELKASGKR
jgi:hypothetical protein